MLFVGDGCCWSSKWVSLHSGVITIKSGELSPLPVVSFQAQHRGHKSQEAVALAQVRVSNAQRGHTHQNVRVWSRERFIAGPCKEMGGSCPEKPQAPRRVSAKHF